MDKLPAYGTKLLALGYNMHVVILWKTNFSMWFQLATKLLVHTF